MQFNSIDFAVFLPIVYLLYWIVFNKNIRVRNIFILFASYFFYAWWDWRFLSLIIFITCVDYFTTRMIFKNDSIKIKRLFLFISLFFDIGILFFFKYYDFFIQSFSSAFTLLGKKFGFVTLNIVLPLGISFYIFQTLSYVFDVYHEKIEPARDITVYATFLSFFPKLIMGPIEKPVNLLPQFSEEKKFDYNKTIDGLRQSTARLFNFDLMKNFNYPYFSRNIAEFWRRWHISLTQWLTVYVFLPIQMEFRDSESFW